VTSRAFSPAKPQASREAMKQVNRALLLQLVKNHGPISRVDLADRSGLSPAAVTGLVSRLISDGLLVETERNTASAGAGRRPIPVDVNADSGRLVGVKLAERRVTAALTDLRARVLGSVELPLDDHSPDSAADAVATAVEWLLEGSPHHRKLLGIGVGLAGFIDSGAGECVRSPILGWRNVPFAALVERRTRVPVRLDNDVNALAMAELLFGAGKGLRHFLVVTIGRGVGLGIVVRGDVYRGARGAAGEFGHTLADPAGPRCDCGNRGCVEALASDPAIIRSYRRHGGRSRSRSAAEVAALARRADGPAIESFRSAGTALGAGLANLINLFDPERIILSGEGAAHADLILDSLRASLHEHTFGGLADRVELVVEPLGDETWARGAASLIAEAIFAGPTVSAHHIAHLAAERRARPAPSPDGVERATGGAQDRPNRRTR